MLILHPIILVDAESEDGRLLHEEGVELAGVGGVVFGGEAETRESLIVLHADWKENWYKALFMIFLLIYVS